MVEYVATGQKRSDIMKEFSNEYGVEVVSVDYEDLEYLLNTSDLDTINIIKAKLKHDQDLIKGSRNRTKSMKFYLKEEVALFKSMDFILDIADFKNKSAKEIGLMYCKEEIKLGITWSYKEGLIFAKKLKANDIYKLNAISKLLDKKDKSEQMIESFQNKICNGKQTSNKGLSLIKPIR